MNPNNCKGNIDESLPKVKKGSSVSGVRLFFLLNLQNTLYYYIASSLLLCRSRVGAMQVALNNSYHTVNYKRQPGLPGIYQEAKKHYTLLEIFSVLTNFLTTDVVSIQRRTE